MRSLAICAVLLVALDGCGPSSGGYRQESGFAPLTSGFLGGFDKLWAARTITLRQERAGGGGPFLPFGGGEPQGGDAGPFPLNVRATFMDSALVETGIRELADLSSMTQTEADSFRTTYRSLHCPDDTLFLWIALSTTSTPEFTDLDRWTIYLENDQGRDFEPSRIVEHPLRRGAGGRSSNEFAGPDVAPDRSGMPWSPVTKDVECYFPLHHFGESLIGSSARTLKLIFLDSKHPRVRAEAAWDLSFLQRR